MKKKKKKTGPTIGHAIHLEAEDIFKCMQNDAGVLFFEDSCGRRHPDMYVLNAGRVHDFVESALRSAEVGFEISASEGKQLSADESKLSSFFKQIVLLRGVYPDYFLPSELVQLFHEIIETPEFENEKFQAEDQRAKRPGKTQGQVYIALIQEIRKRAHEPEFKKAVNYRAQAANDNFISAVSYVDQLFEMYEKLQVVRVECAVANGVDMDIVDDILMAKFAKKCLTKLNNNRRNKRLFGDMAGYLWKLEYLPRRGYYFHFIFFFADTSIDSGWLTDQIGRYWVRTITKNQGRYHDCRFSRGDFLSSCIGIVDSNDQIQRDELRQVLFFLTQKDIYMIFGVHCKGRRFGHGKV